MQSPPFDVRLELDGWALFWAELEGSTGGDGQLAALRQEVCQHARERLGLKSLATDPTVAGLRKLFRAAGTDPTRYRPSSEALLRRVLKGDELPAISPLVDINNSLSVELAVPCCVMANGTFGPPFVFRAGLPGEHYQSLRGPFRLEGRPLLCDPTGPLDTPITGNERVKVTPETQRAWLVAYLPADVLDPTVARDALDRLVRAAPIVRILQTAGSA
jgi:DNA/RNA-binding domain of Phe-tRNA-synthetase-like protein